MTLDEEDLDILRHALGLDQQDRPYRKHYVAPLHSSWFDQCERMTGLGFMVRFGEPDRCGQTFHVTESGARQVGMRLPCA